MKKILFLFFFLLLFFTFFQRSYAVCPDATYDCYSKICQGSTTWTVTDTVNCTNNNTPVPPPVCDTNTYQLTYNVCVTMMDPNSTRCDFNYKAQGYQCDARDRCYDTSIGNIPGQTGGGAGSGSDPVPPGNGGRILPGICDISKIQYDSNGNVIPNSACVAGGIYKQCCSAGGGNPTTSCLNGGCPNGISTAPNVTTCSNIPTPAPTTPTPTPTPTPPPTACTNAPTSAPSTSTTIQALPNPPGCDPVGGSSCPVNCTKTCTDIFGQKCNITGTQFWNCQNGTQWFTNGVCSAICPTVCNATPAPTPAPTPPPGSVCTFPNYQCPSSCQGGGTYYTAGQCIQGDSDGRFICSIKANQTGCYDINGSYCGQATLTNRYCSLNQQSACQYPWWTPNPPPECGGFAQGCFCIWVPGYGYAYNVVPCSQSGPNTCHSAPGDNSTCSAPTTKCDSQNDCYIGGGDGCSGGCKYNSVGPCLATRLINHGNDEICIQYGPAGCYDVNSNYCGPQAPFNGVKCTTSQSCLTTNCQPCDANPSTTCQAPTPPPATPTPTPTPTYTVSGNVFIDANNDALKDNGEVNYTGTININSTGGTVSTSNGSFTVIGLLGGNRNYNISYTNLPTGASLTYPLNGPPPSFTVSVGPGTCSVGGSNSALCDGSGNISSLNFGINYNKPWIQCQGADCRIDSGFIDKLPPNTYANANGAGGNPGLIFTGNATPDFGQGQASATNWIVGGTTFSETYSPTKVGGTVKTSYSYLLSKANQGGITPTDISLYCSGGISNCNLSSSIPHGVYIANGSLNLVGGGLTMPAGQNYVILVNGNLTINERIFVPSGSTAVFSSSGTITVSKTLGEAASSTSSTIEGIYSADQSFIADGNNSCSVGADPRLNVSGSVITNAAGAGGSFQNKRDLCANDISYPTVSFFERVDFILNTPDFLKNPNFTYQEIAP